MASWLYIASGSYAGADATYRFAHDHGLVWRSFYRDTNPIAANDRVRALMPGDELYLGYRNGAIIQLLGRMRIGTPDHPLTVSPVFCEVPANLLPLFEQYDYDIDPILGRMVGIFVEEVQPWIGAVQSPGRSTIYPIPDDGDIAVAEQVVPPAAADPRDPQRHPPNEPVKEDCGACTVSGSNSTAALGEARAGKRTYVGVDVNSFCVDRCFLSFEDGRIRKITFDRVQHAAAFPGTDAMRLPVANGNLPELAHMTYQAAAANALTMRAHLDGDAVAGVFIDSPSGFSRNRLRHGRLCEKNHFRGVSFQSTPSVACGKPHGGDWAWLVYGMVAFVAATDGGQLSEERWQNSLTSGICARAESSSHHVRECFPTATVSMLRHEGLADEVIGLLSSVPDGEARAELAAVSEYLRRGVWAVKARTPLYDRADALVAALTSMGIEFAGLRLDEPLPALPRRNWSASMDVDHNAEGAITVVRHRL